MHVFFLTGIGCNLAIFFLFFCIAFFIQSRLNQMLLFTLFVPSSAMNLPHIYWLIPFYSFQYGLLNYVPPSYSGKTFYRNAPPVLLLFSISLYIQSLPI